MAYAEKIWITYRGRRYKSARWYARYRGADGKWHRKAGYTDKRATEEMARQLESAAARESVGLPAAGAPTPQTLAELVPLWGQSLRDRGRGEKHVRRQEYQVKAVLEACGFKRPGDITAGKIDAYLSRRRALPKTDRLRLAPKTANHYRSSITTFASWVSRETGLASRLTPLASEDATPEWERRVLTQDEFARLVAAARQSTRRSYGLTGPARAALYLAAAYTGFRASELASLTPASLEGEIVHLGAEYAKSGKAAAQPVPAAVAEVIQNLAETTQKRPETNQTRANLNQGRPETNQAARETNRPLWPGKWAADGHAAKLIQRDLAAAGIPYKDARGRVADVHSLRSMYVTSLIRAGVGPEETRRLARHASASTTMRHYAKLEADELRAAVGRLPPPPV